MKEQQRRTPLENIYLILSGFVIGVGCILPGVSGGVMAVTFGLYRRILDAVAGFFESKRKNARFLLPLGIGGVVGLLCGAYVLDLALTRYYIPIMYLFLGLVAGGIPGFVREANEKGFRKRYLLTLALGMFLAGLFMVLGNREIDPESGLVVLTPPVALISGALIAIGTVIPGISTSFILIYLGWYQSVLRAISDLDIVSCLFIGIGAVVCALALIKFIRWLFAKCHGYAYYCVLGFLLISMVMVFPGVSQGAAQALNLGLVVPGFFATFFLSRIRR